LCKLPDACAYGHGLRAFFKSDRVVSTQGSVSLTEGRCAMDKDIRPLAACAETVAMSNHFT
jgi:hypothetical protein